MNEHSQPEPEQDPQAPSRLIAALKKVQPERIFVPPYVDAIVLKAARQHLQTVRPYPRALFRSWKLWPALVTACLIVCGLVYLVTKPGGSTYAKDDINHDGRVDILDSFALAREIRNGKPISSALDINGDGVVDERDIQVLATRAVRLDKSKPS